MRTVGYTETYYVDVMKTLCNMLNRLMSEKGKTFKTRQIVRDVTYGSSQYHYIEKIGDMQIFSIADKSPMVMFKQIIEHNNSKF